MGDRCVLRRLVLPSAAAVALLAIAPGCRGQSRAAPSETAGAGAGASSEVLALLPEGPEKRRFLLDCTSCHQLDAATVFPDGAARSASEWREIVARMLELGGVGTETPLISPRRDAAATAKWLAANLSSPPRPASPPAPPAGAEITAYRFPFRQDLPHDVAVDRKGGVVVTGMFSHRMLRLDPGAERWDTIPIPVETANPRAVEVDGAGDWWVLLGAPGKIARYDPDAEAWDTWDIGMYGHSLRLDGTGRVWFNGHFTRHPTIIGFLDPASGKVTTVEIPDRPEPEADHPMPYGLRVDEGGRIWGTELRGGRLFVHDPASGETVVHRMPDRHAGPRRPAVDAAGRVWIPEYAGNRLTRFDPGSGEFRSFVLPVPDALPYVVEVDRRAGRVWVGTAAADAVFEFDPESEEFTAYPLPVEGALIRHLVVDGERGEIWAAYGALPGVEPRIVRIRPAGPDR